jgi:hypothetical protein
VARWCRRDGAAIVEREDTVQAGIWFGLALMGLAVVAEPISRELSLWLVFSSLCFGSAGAAIGAAEGAL